MVRTFGASTKLIEAVSLRAVGYDEIEEPEGPLFHFKLQENIYSKSWNIHKRVGDFQELRRELAHQMGKNERDMPLLPRITRNR